MKPLYIFDIDGTLADLRHRLHLIKQKSPDWDAFHSSVMSDAPIPSTISTLQMLAEFCDIWYFTGRMETCRDYTEMWLKAHVQGWSNPNVTMRAKDDTRPDYVIKQEMLDNMLDVDRRRLVAVFDDRQKVVQMWRANNITCYQVDNGNF